MKQFFLILFIPTIVCSQPLFELNDLKTAQSRARKEQKNLLLFATTDWCEPCETLETYGLADLEVANFYKKSFVSVKVDMETYPGIALAEKYAIDVFPTLLFLDPNEKLLHRSCGAQDASSLLEIGKSASDGQNNLAYFTSKFENGLREVTFLLDYLNLLDNSCINPETKALQILQEYSLEQLPEEIPWTLFANYHWDLFSDQFLYFQDNLSEFEQSIGKKAAHQKLYDTFLSRYQEVYIAEELQDLGMQSLLYSLRRTPFTGADTLELMMQMHFTEMKEDWKAFARYSSEFVKFTALQEEDQLLDLAWKFYLNVNNQDHLKAALKWAEKIVEQNPSPYAIDVYASLNYKSGKKKKAIMLEERALELAIKTGEDTDHYKYQLHIFKTD